MNQAHASRIANTPQPSSESQPDLDAVARRVCLRLGIQSLEPRALRRSCPWSSHMLRSSRPRTPPALQQKPQQPWQAVPASCEGTPEPLSHGHGLDEIFLLTSIILTILWCCSLKFSILWSAIRAAPARRVACSRGRPRGTSRRVATGSSQIKCADGGSMSAQAVSFLKLFLILGGRHGG